MVVDTATVVSVIGAAVTVGTVLFRTGKLSAAIDHLTSTVAALETHRGSIDTQLSELAQRVSVLEGRAQRKTPP